MYDFKDTTIQAEAGSNPLPAEAIQINGEYIENLIDGYRTLYVTGRELLESDITEIQIGTADGSDYQSKRNTPRTITVGYQLLSTSPEEFREKFNELSRILDQEQARLVFYDEPDKYFIGTKSEVGEVGSGKLNVTGEFSFYCCDPYKHSMTEKTFQARLNGEGIMEATIQNEGTEECAVNYTITHNHENGFVGIVSEYGAMQYGKIDEVDAETLQRSEKLFDYRNPTQFESMTDRQGIFTEDFGKNGTWRTNRYDEKDFLAVDSVGSGSGWHGASKMVYLPQDSSGSNSAQNFLLQSTIWFEAGKPSQTGMLMIAVADESDTLLASMHIMKTGTTDGAARCIMKIRDSEKNRISYTADRNGRTAYGKGQTYIQKTGDLFEFYFTGEKYQYRVPEEANTKARSVSIFVGNYAGRGNSADELVTRMYFDYLFFRKDNVPYANDIPNRYAAGDVMYINGSEGKMYVNGVNCVQDEILGTQYFKVPPGETKVQFLYSLFSDPPPTIAASITEVYI